jgi:hypothetical protein
VTVGEGVGVGVGVVEGGVEVEFPEVVQFFIFDFLVSPAVFVAAL